MGHLYKMYQTLLKQVNPSYRSSI